MNDCTDCLEMYIYDKTVDEYLIFDIFNVTEDISCKMFMYKDYVFKFNGCMSDNNDIMVYGKYISPVLHLLYSNECESYFKLTKDNTGDFIFFSHNEIVIDIFGNVYFMGEYIESLITHFSLEEVSSLSNFVIKYLFDLLSENDKFKEQITKYKKENSFIAVQSPYNYIGLFFDN